MRNSSLVNKTRLAERRSGALRLAVASGWMGVPIEDLPVRITGGVGNGFRESVVEGFDSADVSGGSVVLVGAEHWSFVFGGVFR